MLSFSHLSLRRGPRLLIKDASFTIYRGEKTGIVGANGTGKSSLLALVLGELQPDAGSFDRPAQLEIAHVSQELDATDRPAIEFVMDGDRELRDTENAIAHAEAANDGVALGHLHAKYAAIGGYDARSRAGRLMHGLGFDSADETSPVNSFSGGWRVRLNVAKALMCRSDLLLLDEPTNHLDLDAVIWLEEWLRNYPGTLLMIAHDREFLDRTVDRIVHIEHGEARAYSGNYSAFEEQRVAQLAQQQSMYERQQREIQHMMSFVERFRAKASKARQAQSRIKALERMQRIAPAHIDTPFEFAFLEPDKLPQPLLAIDKQSAGYGERTVLQPFSLTIAPGHRIALLGRNGAGKSTLMKLLAGELQSPVGKRIEARDLRIGYFAQHQLEQLTLTESPLAHLRRLGGPRVSYLRPNLLLLDEPTNHLDLEMRQALAIALQDYAAAVVLVSHDRHLLRAFADELLLVHDGKVAPFDGDLDDYARWFAVTADTKQQPQAATPSPAEDRKQRKREEAEKRARLSPLRAEVARHEQAIQRLEAERSTIDGELMTPELYADGASVRARELMQRRGIIAAQLEEVEAAWLDAAERLERETQLIG